MAKNNKNEKKKYLVVGLIVLLVAVIGVTYAWFVLRLNGSDNKVNLRATTTLALELNNEANEITLTSNEVPKSDEQGRATQAYTFDVVNKSSVSANYNLYIDDVPLDGTAQKLRDEDIKFRLTRIDGLDKDDTTNTGRSESVVGEALLSTLQSRKFNQNDFVVAPGLKDHYELRLWINSEATKENAAGKQFKGKIRVEAVQSNDSNTNNNND